MRFAYRRNSGLGDQSEDHLPSNRSVPRRLLRLRFDLLLMVIIIFVVSILEFAHLDRQRLNYDETASQADLPEASKDEI